MSLLFTPMRIGDLQINNRFVHSATHECMAGETGLVTDRMIRRYERLAKGEIGLIIPGYLYVHPLGRAAKYQTGIHSDEMIDGLQKLVNTVHQYGGKIVFQLVHSGRQTTKEIIGQTPMAPSKKGRDPMLLVKPREMSEGDIQEIIESFGSAAKRAALAGADGVQLHGAHGYLINQFLSPFFNHRNDAWGGSDENRFLFLKEVILEIRKKIPKGMPILIKLNTQDYTPKKGITPDLAKEYAKRLKSLGINGIEVSCGVLSYSVFNVMRGDVPVKELVLNLPWWKKHLARIMLKRMMGKFDLQEGYNIEAAKMIKPVLGEVPLFVVGGLRRVSHMEEVLEKGYADFISMSRPFIRQPLLVKEIKEGKTEAVSCVSCNKCLAAVANDMPVACYNKNFPVS